MVYESLRIVLKIFVTFVKMLGRCENAIFIELLKFWCEVTIIMGCILIEISDGMLQDWWRILFTPDK